jgi:hypothetical protein
MGNNQNQTIGEANKLEGGVNYNVWKLKMRALYCSENMWEIVETKTLPVVFPTQVGGMPYTEPQFRQLKYKAMRMLTLSVCDDLVDTVAEHKDPADAWAALRWEF